MNSNDRRQGKYVMRWSDLYESRYAPLYHGTSISALIQAVHDNALCSGGYYISLSRDITVAKKFACKSESTLEIWMNDPDRNQDLSDDPDDQELAEKLPLAFAEQHFVGSWTSGGAIMVLDQQKIKTRFRVTPFSDDHSSHKWEMEERLTRDIKPLRDFLIEIKLMPNSALGAIARAVISGDEELGIHPHPEYTEAVRFIQSIST